MSEEEQYNREQIDKYEGRAKAAGPHVWALCVVVVLCLPIIFLLPEPYDRYAHGAQLLAFGIQVIFAAYVTYNYTQASKWLNRDIERIDRDIAKMIAEIEERKSKEQR